MSTPVMTRPSSAPARLSARVGALWGIIGVALILGDAIARVWPYTRDAVRDGLSAPQWITAVLWVTVMIVAEGYRGFQQRFAPRVAARAVHLRHHGRGIDLLLAPLYCIGYFHAPRRLLITAWSLTAGITLLIVAVHAVAQPWRGIIDGGVLAGLTYGLVATVALTVRAFRPARQPLPVVEPATDRV